MNAAGTAVGDAIVGAKADVDAAVKRSDAATAKAEVAVETADAANTAATKAVGDAQDAIADVKATEAKLYPASENVLKGTVKDTFVHVDDAFSSAALREIMVEGACRQDGTPSPDNPVPIQVIENPVVQVRGKNLLYIGPGLKPSDCDKRFDKEIKRIIKPGEYVAGLTPSNYYQDITHDVVLTDGGVQYSSDAEGYGVGIGISLVPGVRYRRGGVYNSTSASVMFYTADGTFISFNSDEVFTCPENAFYCVAMYSPSVKNATVSVANAWYGTPSTTEYTPHIGASLTFTLPAEHPYLAKLPDGTADEIVVDEEGNVELVARVQKYDTSNLTAPSEVTPIANGLNRYQYWNVFTTPTKQGGAPCMTPNFASVVNWSFPAQGCYTSDRTFLVVASADPTETLKASGYLYCTLATPARYPLGKIDMPKAQDSIINVWTDAEVTPNTSIRYVRDVNIVVSHLESAIASITEG